MIKMVCRPQKRFYGGINLNFGDALPSILEGNEIVRKSPSPFHQCFVAPFAVWSSKASAEEGGKTHTARQNQSKAIGFWQSRPHNFIGGQYLFPALQFALCSFALLSLVHCGSEANNQQGGGSVGVVGYKVIPKELNITIPLVGTLAAYEAIALKSEIAGKVEDILAQEGSRVKKGEVLFRIGAEPLLAEVEEAKANFGLAEANFKRSQTLRGNKTISAQEFDEARSQFSAAKATLERVSQKFNDSNIVAPFDGIVGERLVSPGVFVQENDQLSSLYAIHPMRVQFDVPERFLSDLMSAKTFSLRVAAYSKKTFEGRVTFVDPAVNPELRTITVKGELENQEGLLRPGMFANVFLTLQSRTDALTVPDSSLVIQGDTVAVYTIGQDNSVSLQPITFSQMQKGEVVVESGLKANDAIVVLGHQKLYPSATVTVREWMENAAS
ncbi:MAG: efflux RND transporter periplasmic adaptor subunit [Bdellovibrionales bacterium]|nr:efflux RND transporter periplasmic adaptor subunit [Bdellovibrionales bacterium]